MINPIKAYKNIRKMQNFIKKAQKDPLNISDAELKDVQDIAKMYGVNDSQVKQMIKSIKTVDENNIKTDDKGRIKYSEDK